MRPDTLHLPQALLRLHCRNRLGKQTPCMVAAPAPPTGVSTPRFRTSPPVKVNPATSDDSSYGSQTRYRSATSPESLHAKGELGRFPPEPLLWWTFLQCRMAPETQLL